MKLIFKYYFNISNMYEPICKTYGKLDSATCIEIIVSEYLNQLRYIELVDWALSVLTDSGLTNGCAGSESFDADIDVDKVWMQFSHFDPEEEEYDPFCCRVCINRQEIIYTLTKWADFLQRKIDPSYKEIIDTMDCFH